MRRMEKAQSRVAASTRGFHSRFPLAVSTRSFPRLSARSRLCRDEPPELPLIDDRHLVPLRGETPNLDQLRAPILSGNLLLVRPAADQHVSRLAWFRLNDRSRLS